MTTSVVEEMFGLRGHRALVTGARSGIGAAAAVGLAAAGTDVVLWGRSEASLAGTVARCREHGVDVSTVAGDLSDTERTAATARALDQDIDILVNNAGTIDRSPALDIQPGDWRRVLATNLDSPFALAQVLGAGMVERGHGTVISIASLLSFQGGVGVASYATSKHAIAGLTKALATEWAPSGVSVNAVAPGYIHTDNTQALRDDPDRYAAIRDRIPAGRWGEPDDVVGAVVFLAGPAARYVTGHTLVVDGGWLAR